MIVVIRVEWVYWLAGYGTGILYLINIYYVTQVAVLVPLIAIHCNAQHKPIAEVQGDSIHPSKEPDEFPYNHVLSIVIQCIIQLLTGVVAHGVTVKV